MRTILVEEKAQQAGSAAGGNDVVRRQAWISLAILFAVNMVNFFDRQILAAVAEPLRTEWGLTDTRIGWLVTSFTLLYAAVGIPLGRLADLGSRKRLLSAGLALWSALTCASGLARGFWSLFSARMGIGVGEAACAPAATSLIGDLFPAGARARAMSIFMLGLPAGVSLSYIVSGFLAQHFGWRTAFFVAGIPGLLLSLLAAAVLHEPARGRVETHAMGSARRPGSPYRLILTTPTMWWIIASGALHNFMMYALTFFLPSFLIRYHHVSLQTAGFLSGAVIGTVGAVGMIAGGWLGDAGMRLRRNGRMLLAASAVLLSVPLGYLALAQPAGALAAFMLLEGLALTAMYTYYAAVYATIQDVVEPALRGTAMALYFFAMYVLGASVGPVVTGRLSDFLARRAALEAGRAAGAAALPEAFRAAGLHQAMYLIPTLGIVLAAVLFAGAVTVRTDIRRLEEWTRGCSPAA